jgi:hypothetical protein
MEKHVHKISLTLTFPTPITYEEAEARVFDALDKGGFKNASLSA